MLACNSQVAGQTLLTAEPELDEPGTTVLTVHVMVLEVALVRETRNESELEPRPIGVILTGLEPAYASWYCTVVGGLAWVQEMMKFWLAIVLGQLTSPYVALFTGRYEATETTGAAGAAVGDAHRSTVCEGHITPASIILTGALADGDLVGVDAEVSVSRASIPHTATDDAHRERCRDVGRSECNGANEGAGQGASSADREGR